MAREKVDNKLNVVIGTKAQVVDDTTIPDNSIVVVTDEELKANEIVYDDDKNVEEAIDDLNDLVETKEQLSNKATNFGTVNDTLYPSVKAVKDQLDLTAKLAVSNVFTQPQQVPNATLPQHTVNKLQVETMFEMFKSELRGYNLAMPDLTGKTEISPNTYRLFQIGVITLDYNIINGNYISNSTGSSASFASLSFNVEIGKQYTLSSIYVSGSTSGAYRVLINGSYYDLDIMINQAITFTPTTSTNITVGYASNMISNNFTFKLQLEKGSTATPYTVPGQIPAYKIVGEE